jgi:ComF family protein
MASLSQNLKNISLSALDWLFPPACLGCGKEGDFICQECFAKVRLVPNKVCNLCGNFTSKKGYCPNCARNKPEYSGFRAFAYYEGTIRKAIQQLKYHNDLGIGRYLAGFLELTYARTGWDADLVVPIPIGAAKREQRGYNQAERLAQPFCERTGISYCPEALSRIHEFSSQVGLNEKERQANVRNAFIAAAKLVKGKSVLLIDDVFTSGATMQAAASEVLSAGADTVWCLTLAKVGFD